jgi:hypothetical protein
VSDAVNWLPNLVGKVSIWKLAVDLNEARFFDGRLLVPETEGSDRLPASVTWNVEGLVPLGDALAQYPDEAAGAVRDFAACVERVRTELGDPASPYATYKDAFSVPALDASSGAYFYSPRERKLYVTNWGASPRAIAGREQKVFGYDAFGSFVEQARNVGAKSAAPAAGAAVAAAAAVAPVAVAATKPADPPAEAAKDENRKEEEKKKEGEGRPWWIWLLVGLGVLGIALLIAWLLRDCDKHRVDAGADGGDAAALVDGSAAMDSGLDGAASADSRGDAASAADGGDAGDASALADGGDAGGDALDAGVVHRLSDGGLVRKLLDGGLAHDGNGKVIVVTPGKGGGGSGSGKQSGKGGAGGDDGARALRTHFHPEATHWRVVAGQNALDPDSPVEGDGQSFEITLRPGKTDEGVKVEYQDAGGKWHPF